MSDRDRTAEKEAFWANYEKVFGNPSEALQIGESPEDRKLKEWGLMYDCLQNMHLYDYPVQEAKEVLKRIKI